jgi:hypothetical protein
VGYTLRSGSLLQREECMARVFQSGIKTGGGATACGAHDIITGITWSGS